MTDDQLWQAAVQHHQAGRRDAAEPLYRQLLELRPGHADGWHLLGLLLHQSGRSDEGITCIQRAIALHHRQPAFHNNLGEIYRLGQRLNEAAACFRQALAEQPNFPEAHFNLANTLKAQGQHTAAIDHYRRALHLRPAYAKAHFNLANTLMDEGLVKAAAAAYQQAVALRPDWAEAHFSLGNAYFQLREFDQASECYQRARAVNPDGPELDSSLGNTLVELGQLDEARNHFARELARHPERWLRRLRLETLADPVPADNAAIDAYRTALLATLDRWTAGHPPVPLAELHFSSAQPSLLLAYQGRDDRAIKVRYADLFAGALPVGDPRPSGGKPSVGIVVTHGHEGVFYKCLGGIFERMAAERLRLTLVCCHSGVNILRHFFRNPVLEYLELPDRLDQAAEVLRAARFDLLHYWEVGTDSTNYFLPYLRPAPIQSTTWGWPVTTGNPRIDYHVSSELLEPPNAQRFYTEQLVQLKSLPACYTRPPTVPPAKDRAALGLDEGTHLYVCTQNLLKYHPDFDELMAGILRSDLRGRLVCLEGQHPRLRRLLDQRLRRYMPDVLDRVQWLGWLSEKDYYPLLRMADAVLDTPHYSGANTVYDAFHVGTPVVTLAGNQQRGRYAVGAYRQMEMADLVAVTPEEYIRLAVRLGTEADLRHDLSHRIQEASAVLFEDVRAVSALEEFFLSAIAAGPRREATARAEPPLDPMGRGES